MRMRSPSRAPPVNGLVGSTARMPTVSPRFRISRGEAVDQRALAGAGRAGDAHHPRPAGLAVDAADQLALPGAAVLEERDRPPQGARIALEEARDEVVEAEPLLGRMPASPARGSIPGLRPNEKPGEPGSPRFPSLPWSRLQPAFRFSRSPGIDARAGASLRHCAPSAAAARSPAAGSRWCPRRWCRSWRRGSTSRPGSP